MREEDKAVYREGNEETVLYGYLKGRILAYSSPVMLISRKHTKDKRVVMDFRHLNVRIAKNNLACPLVREHFLSVGEFKM